MKSESDLFVGRQPSNCQEIEQNYFIATYNLRSRTNLRDAAWAIAVGQSVGNPNMRSEWETSELFNKHACIILGDEENLRRRRKGRVAIGFPIVNIDWEQDGVSQLLCHLMGGHLDIDIIEGCGLIALEIPNVVTGKHFLGPGKGISGIRDYTGSYNRPLLGGIVKPKTGVSPEVLLDIVKAMVDGGVDFIKEDEIMSNPACCPLAKRVPLISKYLEGTGIIYAVCITADPMHLVNRINWVRNMGANAIHLNIWSGLGAYQSARRVCDEMFLFFQKSGDRIMTTPTDKFYIHWDVICHLAGLIGVDFIHAGMWGGYMSNADEELQDTLDILHEHDVMPSLSCGMHPGLVGAVQKRFGNDWMANCGGAIHGHPVGTRAGALAMRQAIDNNHGDEYAVAIKKWGLVE